MLAFIVLGLLFPNQADRLAWGTSTKRPISCQAGRKTLTHSVPWKIAKTKAISGHSTTQNAVAVATISVLS